MLDIKFIRENIEAVRQSLKDRNLSLDLDKLVSVDDSRRKLIAEVEELRAKQNRANDEIGKLLGISERTARAHVAAIMEKLDASDRAAAVARGFESGILKA